MNDNNQTITIDTPWDDNLLGWTNRKIILLARNKDGSTKHLPKNGHESEKIWEVIDAARGITYKTDFIRANEVFDNHIRKYYGDTHARHANRFDEFSLSPNTYSIYHFHTKAEYLYSGPYLRDGSIVYRIYIYRPIPIEKQQGPYELFRLVFSGTEAWTEKRDGERQNVIPADVFSPKSIYRNMKSESMNFPTKNDWWNKGHNIEYLRKMQVRSKHFREPISPKAFLRLYFASLSKQHFYKSVPSEVKDYVISGADDTLPGYVVLREKRDKNSSYIIKMAIFNKDGVWFFSQNHATEEWHSVPKRVCNDIIRQGRAFTFNNRKLYKQFKKAGIDGEFLQAKKEDVVSCGILEYLDMRKEWLSVEQADKMGRYDIATRLISDIRSQGGSWGLHEEERFFKKTDSLPTVLGIPGAHIKFIRPFDSNAFEHYYSRIRACEEYKDIIPDAETRLQILCAKPCEIREIYNSFRRCGKSKESFLRFIRALSKREWRGLLIREFLDIQNMHPALTEYFRTRDPEQPIPPRFPKPSKIRDVHADMVRLETLMQTEMQRERSIKIDELIEAQYEKNKHMEIADNNYSLILPRKSADLIQEGIQLKHCVGSYADAVANGVCVILFLRKTSERQTSFMTMEVRANRIRQLFGLHDSFNTSDSVKEFVTKYAEKMEYRIECPI